MFINGNTHFIKILFLSSFQNHSMTSTHTHARTRSHPRMHARTHTHNTHKEYYLIILISNEMQLYTVYFIWKLLYVFRVVPPPILRSAYNCIYSVWYLSHRNCNLPLSWKRWNLFECAVDSVLHSQHTQTGSSTSTIAAGSNNGLTNTRCCRYNCLSS